MFNMSLTMVPTYTQNGILEPKQLHWTLSDFPEGKLFTCQFGKYHLTQKIRHCDIYKHRKGDSVRASL